MPIGIIANVLSVAIGAVIGGTAGQKIPQRMREPMMQVCGLVAFVMGLTLVFGVHSMPAVSLATLLGGLFGEAVNLQGRLEGLSGKLGNAVAAKIGSGRMTEQDIARFVSVVVIFCSSGTGMLGAMTEGMTGDGSILLSKAVIDIFTALIFGSTLGVIVGLVALPQAVVFLSLFALARVILPLTTPAMIADFMACGGVITIATGIRVCEIKALRVANLLPGMVLAMPVSWLWTAVFG